MNRTTSCLIGCTFTLASLISPSAVQAMPGWTYAGRTRTKAIWVQVVKREKMFVTFKEASKYMRNGKQKVSIWEKPAIMNCKTMQTKVGRSDWSSFGPGTIGMAIYDAICTD